MEKIFKQRIEHYFDQLNLLLRAPLIPFNLLEGTVIPHESGLYAIYGEESNLLYIGISSDLRRRLLGDHRGGDRQASSFRRNLSQHLDLDSEEKISEYIVQRCSFKYLVMEAPKNLEHFAISVLVPPLNR